ncbi:hypothetical protein SAMN05192574_102298 [Mucilaginibacter gossypiicola]|uniref:Uncharacterized protein n=1 Tax=Mucilaginibacter gossypiicola TaxID=551995 RepID=A0A1H8DD27_9SPHI|nr:hypothetical protein [Mucilaginibacter gossypiicola]SEN05005.1 hypothetical protein SAMN05192574_102298 [Mucilaginibacter gossypiicola]
MQHQSDYHRRERNFEIHVAVLNEQYKDFLADNAIKDIRMCFHIVLSFGNFGLPYFRLSFSHAIDIPKEIKDDARNIFKKYFVDYNK